MQHIRQVFQDLSVQVSKIGFPDLQMREKLLPGYYKLSKMSSMVVIKGLKITDDQIRYIFPRNIDKIISFKYLLPMRTLLKEEFIQLGLPNFPYYQTKRHMKKQINKLGPVRRRRFRDPAWKPVQREQVELIEIFCRYCSNTLTFAFNERQRCFKLRQFSVEHIHGRDKDQHEVYKENTNPAVYYWSKKQHENIQNKINDLVNRLEQPIGPSPEQMQEAEQEPNDFPEMIEMLRKKDYFVYYQPQNFLEKLQLFPDVFMFISPSMKQTYLKYHYCVGFDYTFSLIKEEPLKQNEREYLVGTISGLNQFRRLSIFALVVSNGQTINSTTTVFTQFFNYMGDQPRSIVTDQSPGIIWGLRRLQQNGIFKGEALWDTFHTLKNYKMANPPLKQKMRVMIRQKCKFSFQKMYLEAVSMARTQNELDSLHRFMYESQKYCISQINPILVGMGVSNSQNQFVNSLIKDIITHEKKYVHVIYDLSKFIEERNDMNHVIKMPNINVEEAINRKDLKLLRLSLNIRYLSFFFTQYFRLINVNMIHQLDKTVYYIQDRMNTHRVIKNQLYKPRQNQPVTNEHKDINYKYKCSCEFREKTGIPCQHLLKVSVKNKDNLLEEIHPKYVIKDPSDLIRCIKSANKSDYNVPINKRGTWSSGRMLETYYVDKNSLQTQAQKKSADPRLIQPIPKGYLPALEQRNKIRNIRTEAQQSRRKARDNSLRTLSFHRFAHEGDFPEPNRTYQVKERDRRGRGRGRGRGKKEDRSGSMDSFFDDSVSSKNIMSSQKEYHDDNQEYSQSFLQSSSSLYQDKESNEMSFGRDDNPFSEFSQLDSQFSRNSLKSGKIKKKPKKFSKSKRFWDEVEEDESRYHDSKSLYSSQSAMVKTEKIHPLIKLNHDQMEEQDKGWGENDAMLQECNYINISSQQEGEGDDAQKPKKQQRNSDEMGNSDDQEMIYGENQDQPIKIEEQSGEWGYNPSKIMKKSSKKGRGQKYEDMFNQVDSDMDSDMMNVGFYDDSISSRRHAPPKQEKKRRRGHKMSEDEDNFEDQFDSLSVNDHHYNRNSEQSQHDDDSSQPFIRRPKSRNFYKNKKR